MHLILTQQHDLRNVPDKLYHCLATPSFHKVMEFLAALLLLLLVGSEALRVRVADVDRYSRLRSFNQSVLYRIEADTDYEYPPYLIYLTGSRYGEQRHITIALSHAAAAALRCCNSVISNALV